MSARANGPPKIAAASLRPRYARPTANNIPPGRLQASWMVQNCAKMWLNVKKCAKMFGRFAGISYLRGMNEPKLYVITAKNRLTKEREEISGPLPQEVAEERLQREQAARIRQRHLPWTHLKCEPLEVVKRRRWVQLELHFT